DGLLLAEVLVKLLALPLNRPPATLEAFSHDSRSRLEQRIEALISPPASGFETTGTATGPGLMLSLLPLITVLLHGG
ncbi:peptidase M56 BlaR1, partial [filamentous cyanobacterium CCP5]